MAGMPTAERNIANDEDARLAAMRRAALPPVRIAADSTAPGGEDPNHLSTNTEATSIGGLNTSNAFSAPSPAPSDAISRAADLAKQATAGGPPPGFTGTFNGKAYSGGQLLDSSNTGGLPTTGAGSHGPLTSGPTTVSPTAAATSGSLGPTSVPTGTGSSGSGSLAPALQPTSTTGSSNVTTVTDGGGGMRTTPIAEPGAPGAGTTNINAPGAADIGGVATASGNPGAKGELGPAGSGDLGAVTNSVITQLQQIQQSLAAPGAPTDVTATYMKSAQSILAMLDQQEAQLRAENEKQGTTIDPATQFTIDKLRETLDTNLKTMKEDLNRRGLSDSGIQLELENRLTKGSASDQAGILADRLSKLQDQLQQGLTNIRSQKYSTANQYGLAGANAQTAWDENTRKLAQDREQNALSGMLSLRGQMSTAENARLSEIAAGQRASASETAAMARALVNEQGANSRNSATINAENARAAATLAENQREFGTLSAAQQATNARTAGTATARAAAAASAPAAKTASTVAAAQAAINNDYQTSGDAISAVQARQAQIVAQVGTAGYNAILQHAASLPTGRNGSNY